MHIIIARTHFSISRQTERKRKGESLYLEIWIIWKEGLLLHAVLTKYIREQAGVTYFSLESFIV